MSRKSEIHVTKTDSGWKAAYDKNGDNKTVAEAKTKAEVLKEATAAAKKAETELVIHKGDGSIQNKNSFGNDPHPPIDKK